MSALRRRRARRGRVRSGWLVALFCAGTPAIAAEPSAEGLVLFNASGCWACHGTAGQGTLSGPQIAPTKLPLAAVQQLLRHPAKLMPAYDATVLNDAQVASIYAYLTSVPASRPAEDIPLLQH